MLQTAKAPKSRDRWSKRTRPGSLHCRALFGLSRVLYPALVEAATRTRNGASGCGFVLRWLRDGASYPLESQGFATLQRLYESLFRRPSRPAVFTRSALQSPFLAQTLGRLSVSRGLVNRCWLRSFGPNPPGLAFEWKGKTKTGCWVIGV